MLNGAALGGFKRYLRRFAHAALAPMRWQVPDPATGAMVLLDAERMASIEDSLLQSIIGTLFRPGTINLQKYLVDQYIATSWILFRRADVMRAQ